jgi:hypothetical protein
VSLKSLYRRAYTGAFRSLAALGWNVSPTADFYSPLPVRADLEKHRARWDRPSEMVGVRYDLDGMRTLLRDLVARFGAELPDYEQAKRAGYGPGFTTVDAQTLYLMLRHIKPRRYVEVGSGLSTYYAWLALERNRAEGASCSITCIDPFPTGRLEPLGGVTMIASLVQDAPLARFAELEAGDVLFIDSTHVLKVDGDVAFLYLEVVPRLAPGVIVHAHDIPFPYNTPHPAEAYVLGAKWPLYRTEPMLLQALLAFNDRFDITLSAPMLRHFDESFLAATLPGYRGLDPADFDTHFGSIWFRRTS